MKVLPAVSLRELLLLVAFVAVACGSILYASPTVVCSIFATTVLLGISLAVFSVVERGARQAAAFGGLIAIAVYAILWSYEPKVELESLWSEREGMDQSINYQGYLPTSHALNALWNRTSATYMVERQTGRVLKLMWPTYPQFESQAVSASEIPAGWSEGQLAYEGLPKPRHFLAIGHCLFAWLFAYLCGKFAAWVYYRRMVREATAASGDA